MAIPDFQSIMLPLLRCLDDGKEHSNDSINECLQQYFKLSADEINQLLPSGRQRIFGNRVAWAKTHLKQAGLIESTGRGLYRISQRGSEVLAENPTGITIKYLMRFPGFKNFREGKIKEVNGGSSENHNEGKTPQEYIDIGYGKIVQKLSSELVEIIKKSSSYFFEKLVVDLVLAMGYGGSRDDAGTLTGRSADEGIDGVINEDRLGLDVIYIQAKKWNNPISRPELQKFAGALLGKKARKGIFITTSTFTKEARSFARSIEAKIVLIDGCKLAEFMIQYNVGVSVEQVYEIKKVDMDYFLEEQ